LSYITLLDWDTEFFGFPVAQIVTDRLDQNNLDEALRFCREHQVKLLQFKCDAHHRPSVLLAEANSFHMADIRITFGKRLKAADREPFLPDDISFRIGEEKDISVLKEIVTDLYTHSRYYVDSNFPREDVHIFYGNWIEKSVRGDFDDCVWLLAKADLPVGCCSISYESEVAASIGLFAVDEEFSGQGLGALLLGKVFQQLISQGVKTLSVATQGRNYLAQRLYQRVGFQTEKFEIYYHCWFDV